MSILPAANPALSSHGSIRVLMVVDTHEWILARIATSIAAENVWLEPTILSANVLKKLLQRAPEALGEIDLVHFVIPNGGDLIGRFKGKVPLVTSMHHFDSSQPISLVEQGDVVMVVARQWRDWWLDRGRDPKGVFLLPNGVDSGLFIRRDEAQREHLRSKLGITRLDKVVGFAGKPATVPGRKGTDVFVRALKRLAAMDDRVVALLIGPGWDQLAASLREQGVRVIAMGFLNSHSTLADLYAAMDVFLITARIEGGPCTLLEAMSAGRCVVSSPVGMALDVIESGVNGFIVPGEDSEEFANTAHLLLNDDAVRERAGRAARATIEASYDWSTTATGAAALYASAITRFTGTPIDAEAIRRRSPRAEHPTTEGESLYAISPLWRNWVMAQEQLNWMRIVMDVGERNLARRIAWSTVKSRPVDIDVYRELHRTFPDHWLAKGVSWLVGKVKRR